MAFRVTLLRLTLRAARPLHFPAALPGNALRGYLGALLHGRDPALYDRFFAPAAFAGPSGLRDRPRPFVLRPRPLAGRRIPEGAVFPAVLHLFAPELTAPLLAALDPLAAEAETVDLDLTPRPAARLRVRFLSPTALKEEGRLLTEPVFPALALRAAERVATLAALYQPPAPPADWPALTADAAATVTESAAIHQQAARRRSARSGVRHPLGGFTGEAVYRGPLSRLAPYLAAAQWTGAGRHTPWGLGELEVTVLP